MNIKTLSVENVIQIHDDILKNSKGLPGLAANKSLSAALQRIDNNIFYEGVDDLFEIAALIVIALAQGHVFNDGNKRTAFMTCYNFLDLNGYDLYVPEDEAEDTMVAVAEKQIDLKSIAIWLKKYSSSI